MEDAVRLMPKIDLHCHLDGSLTLESVRKITGRNVAPEELQADDRCRDLAEYLKKFDIPIACLKTAEALRIAARDFLLDAAKENICYIETRFAPLHSEGEGLNSRQAVESVLEGLAERRARVELPGGALEIEWSEADGRVYMTGPAEVCFTGDWPEGDPPRFPACADAGFVVQ